MYDFICFDISHLSRTQLDNIPDKTLIKQGTDRKGYPFVKYKWHSFTINYSNITKTLSGSIHHFWNILEGRESHNCNDLDLSDLKETISRLASVFDLRKVTRIRVLEFGVNIECSFNPKVMMKKNLVGYRKKVGSSKDYKSRGQQCHIRLAENLLIKIYDKGKHQKKYSNGRNILRIEMRFESNREIQQAMKLPKGHIVTLSDIYCPSNIAELNARLLYVSEGLMIVDTINPR